MMRIVSCREVSRALAHGEGGWLARLHLLYCAQCRRFLAQLRAIARNAFPPPDPRRVAALEKAVLARLRP
jgi:hypothetical protein